MFKIVLYCLLILKILSSCDNCIRCTKFICLDCEPNYILTNGYCQYIGLSTGAIVGIVIGGTLLSIIFTLTILWFVVCCSEIVQEKIENVEAQAAENQGIQPNNKTFVLAPSTRSVSSYRFQNQNSQGMLNTQSAISRPMTPSSIFTIGSITNRSQFHSRLVSTNSHLTLQNQDTCTICININTNIKLVPCGHQFHVKCLVNWINKKRSCPNCNAYHIQAVVACNTCGVFKQYVTFCSTGCQKPNHYQCFVLRNSDKLTCKGCKSRVNRMSFPSIVKR